MNEFKQLRSRLHWSSNAGPLQTLFSSVAEGVSMATQTLSSVEIDCKLDKLKLVKHFDFKFINNHKRLIQNLLQMCKDFQSFESSVQDLLVYLTLTFACLSNSIDHDMSRGDFLLQILVRTVHSFLFYPIDEQTVQLLPSTIWAQRLQLKLLPVSQRFCFLLDVKNCRNW